MNIVYNFRHPINTIDMRDYGLCLNVSTHEYSVYKHPIDVRGKYAANLEDRTIRFVYTRIDLNSQKRKFLLFFPPDWLHSHDVQGVYNRHYRHACLWAVSVYRRMNIVYICTMYQRKVGVDMLNAVKSVLADVLNVSSSSEQSLCCEL